MRQHTSAYGGVRPRVVDSLPAYVRIRQRCVSIRPHTEVSGRGLSIVFQQTSPYVSIRPHTSAYVRMLQHAYAGVSSHTSAYVSIRQHTSAYVSIRTFVLVRRPYLYLCTRKASKNTSRRWKRAKARYAKARYACLLC
jgi:hypothetical protein